MVRRRSETCSCARTCSMQARRRAGLRSFPEQPAAYHAIDFEIWGQDGWLLGFGKLGFGRKAAKLRILRDSSAVSFQLSYSSSLVAPDLTLSTFWLRQMPAPRMSIGLKPSCCEPTATPAVLKSLTQAREQPWGKPPCFKHARGCSRSTCAVSVLPLRPS